MTAKTYYRLGLLVAAGTGLLLLFGVGALGIVGPGGPADLPYVLALLVAVIGALLARFRAPGMALALLAGAAGTATAGIVSLYSGMHRTQGASVLEIIGLTAMFVVGYATAAGMFYRAAAELDA